MRLAPRRPVAPLLRVATLAVGALAALAFAIGRAHPMATPPAPTAPSAVTSNTQRAGSGSVLDVGPGLLGAATPGDPRAPEPAPWPSPPRCYGPPQPSPGRRDAVLAPLPADIELANGSLKGVLDVLSHAQSDAERCGAGAELAPDAGMRAFALAWQIADGRAIALRSTRDSTDAPFLARCLRASARRLRFDPSVNGEVHEFAWAVTPGGGGSAGYHE